MVKVLRPISIIDKYVIKEDNDIFVKVWGENIIHEGLKSGWGIVKSKGHDSKFKMPMVGAKDSFGTVRWGDGYLVIA